MPVPHLFKKLSQTTTTTITTTTIATIAVEYAAFGSTFYYLFRY